MKNITVKNVEKFTNHVTKKLMSVGCTVDDLLRFHSDNFTATIDIDNSVVYSVFMRFKKNYPSFVNNQFSGKHNFHFIGSLKNAKEQFDIYFLDVKNSLTK